MELNPEEQTEGLHDFIQGIVGVEWLSTLITVVLAAVFTAVLAHVVTKFLRHLLSHDNSPLPSSSIFVNIARVVVWCVGASVVLSSCFNVDVSAAVTALGIGGIAISLGFQDTLANLIGGLQVSITGLVEPGDHIDVGGQRGIVRDVTWRHTTIENTVGERIVVPNSVINKTALVKLRPISVIVVPVVVTAAGEAIERIAADMEQAANAAVAQVCEVEKPARTYFSEVTDYGYRGTLTLTIADPAQAVFAKDATLRAIAPFAHAN
ncbi:MULTISPECIES: mechanosensitive ion channel family protein [unclassified Adlercreutzia]|uniref:mechanosensitive ion channel family protein n=1 Tax=unclassified Adlercreutzia TaxID=2636013 RepID=UPI0013ED4231|nr:MULTISPECIES: mechanosensitive ion channel domain-containing protein [unclassified Adlercreutzia]